MFYNETLITLKSDKTINQIGQKLQEYIIDSSFEGDVQPINSYDKTTQWGSDIISEIQVFTDHIAEVGQMILYKDNTYEIEKKIPWDDYTIYALKGVDIVVH